MRSEKWAAGVRQARCYLLSSPFSEHTMVLTKAELIAALQNEVRILLHLADKVDPAKTDYRPTPKQRSTIELLRYLTMMGPAMATAAAAGSFDEAAWAAAEEATKTMTLAQAKAAIAGQTATYAATLGNLADADFRAEISLFGPPTTRGVWLVSWVLSGCVAYRTQLFLYLKACGREELGTMNLWAGIDAPGG